MTSKTNTLLATICALVALSAFGLGCSAADSAAAEGDIAFAIHLAHDLRPVGRTGTVTRSEGLYIHTIDPHTPYALSNDDARVGSVGFMRQLRSSSSRMRRFVALSSTTSTSNP